MEVTCLYQRSRNLSSKHPVLIAYIVTVDTYVVSVWEWEWEVWDGASRNTKAMLLCCVRRGGEDEGLNTLILSLSLALIASNLAEITALHSC